MSENKIYFDKTIFGNRFSLQKVYGYKPIFQFTGFNLKKEERFLEISTGLNNPCLKYSCASFESPYHNLIASIGYGFLSIHFPWKNRLKKYQYGDDDEYPAGTYGFSTIATTRNIPDTLIIYNNDHSRIYDLPWCYNHINSWYLSKDQKWEKETEKTEKENRYQFTTPFVYVTTKGYEQHTMAHVFVSMNIRRSTFWNKLKITGFDKKSIRVDIEFDDEVGENVGSWKGGTYAISMPITSAQKNMITNLDAEIALPRIMPRIFKEIQDKRML